MLDDLDGHVPSRPGKVRKSIIILYRVTVYLFGISFGWKDRFTTLFPIHNSRIFSESPKLRNTTSAIALHDASCTNYSAEIGTNVKLSSYLAYD